MDSCSKVYDLCIVGAGMFGCAAAKHACMNQKLNICLIGPEEPTETEWPDRLILSSHYDEGRIISGKYNDSCYKQLWFSSVKNFQALEKEIGTQLYHNTGLLQIYNKGHSRITEILSEIEAGSNLYLNLSNKTDFYTRYPFLKLKNDESAFLRMESGYLSPRKLLKSQKIAAKERGCIIFEGIVNDIKETNNEDVQIFMEDGRIVNAKQVLICAGAFTNFIPIFEQQKLSMNIDKDTYILFKISDSEVLRLKDMPPVTLKFKAVPEQPNLFGAYILPPIKYPDGNYYLKIGHGGSIVDSELKTLQEIKNWYDSKGEQYVTKFYTEILYDLIPGLEVEEIVSKTCVTSSNSTGYPYIDRLNSKISFAAVGNGGGATICDEVGRIAAAISLGDSKLADDHFKAIFA